MTSSGSRTPPPEGSDDGPAALSDLVTALRARGLSVGVDDALRIARAFQHGRSWSQEKRVRILKALIARTDDERRVIDQLAQFLFLDAAHESASRSVEPARRDWSELGPNDKRDKPPPEKPPAPRFAARSRSLLARAAKWAVPALSVVVVAALAVVVWRLVPRDQGEVSLPSSKNTPASSGEEPESVPPVPGPVSLVRKEPEPQVAPVPSCPYHRDWSDWVQSYTPLIASALGVAAALWLALLWRRERRGRRQEARVRRVAESTGPRVYHLDVPGDEPRHPLEPGAIRDAAFQLSAPRREVSAPWVAPRETVLATTKHLGLLSLRFARWREQTSLVVLEDVSTSMVKWPRHGAQLVEALRRQGGDVIHYFFDRSPARLSESAELERPTELDVVLCAHQQAVVLVVSDAASVEPGYGSEPLWVRLLGSALWLHPAPESLWGRGARWLAPRLRVVAMSPEGLLRLGAEGQRGGAVAPPWEPPQVASRDPSAVLSAWRGALTAGCRGNEPADDSAFWLLSAGALLQLRGGLTVRLLAALREEVLATPWEETERLWLFPTLSIGGDGTLQVDRRLAEALAQTLRRERPDLARSVVDWAGELIQRTSQGLDPESLAGLFARMTRLRLDAESATRRPAALEGFRRLREEGFGDALSGYSSATEREGWGLGRFRRVPRPGRAAWVLAPALAAVAVLGPLGFRTGVLQRVWPREPLFSVATSAGTWQPIMGQPSTMELPEGDPPELYVCDHRWLETELRIWVDGAPESAPLARLSESGTWNLSGVLGGHLPAIGTRDLKLEFGYSDAHRVALTVGLKAAEADPGADAGTDAAADAGTDAGTDADAEADTGVDAGAGADTGTDAGADAEVTEEPEKPSADAGEAPPPTDGGELQGPSDASSEVGETDLVAVVEPDDPPANRVTEVAVGATTASATTSLTDASVVALDATAPVAAKRKRRRMLPIPEGTFKMGDVVETHVEAFQMDEKEVTTAQYQACVEANGCTPAGRDSEVCNWGKPERSNHPINCVDWNQAAAYCKWEGKRLPTEEEWEYAARGTDGRTYPWGEDPPSASFLCWNRPWDEGTCPVGSFPSDKSPFGLYDMGGNVWEWTSTRYCESYQADCKANTRVSRGGSWNSDDPSDVRAADRFADVPSFQCDNLGFRCAR